MPILLLLLVLAAVAAGRLAGRGARFMRGLSSLLDPPIRVERTFLDLLRGREALTGSFGGHRLIARLQQSRQYQTGHFSIAMETETPMVADIRRRSIGTGEAVQDPFDVRVSEADADVLRSWLTDSSVRAALDRLVVQRGLTLEIERAFVRVTLRPTGWSLLTMFPGRFVPDHWRPVLGDVRALAESIERLS